MAMGGDMIFQGVRTPCSPSGSTHGPFVICQAVAYSQLYISDAFNAVSCSHDRAIWYFIESVAVSGCHFQAHPCSSWTHFKGGNCSSCNGSCPEMGINADQSSARGRFFLSTGSSTPFCSTRMYIHDY